MTSTAPLALDAPNLTEQVVAALHRRVAGRRIRQRSENCRAKASSSPPTTSAARSSARRSRSCARAGSWRRAAGIGTFARDARPADTAFPVPPRRPGDAGRGARAAGAAHQPRDRGRGAGGEARRRQRRSSACARCSRRSSAAAQTGGDAADPDFEFHCDRRRIDGQPLLPRPAASLGRAIIPRTRIDSSAAAHQDRGDYLRAVNREHQDIFRAIARNDSDAARAAMRTHLANSRERLRVLKGEANDG